VRQSPVQGEHDDQVTDWDEIDRDEAKRLREVAVELLGDSEFITVEVPSDPDWPDDAGDYLLGFSDVASHSFSDLIDETVDWLITREGIRDATREDRELVCLWGDIEPAALRFDLLAWWHERLNQIVNRP
jgi:hypothetical protein